MDKTDFDQVIIKPFEEQIIEYGILKGSNTVVFTKAGANGSMHGYQNKYLHMALNLHKKYGYSVVCSSNPYASKESIGQGINVIETFIKSPYQIYYFGYSNGALIGARHAFKYPQIKRMALVNAPLMLNWIHTRKGIENFKGDKMAFIYGDKDPSYMLTGILRMAINPVKSVHIIQNADHHFTDMLSEFINLPEKYLVKK